MHAMLGYTYHFRWKENCCTNSWRNFASVTSLTSVIQLRNKTAVYYDITSQQPELNLEISTCYNYKDTKGYAYTLYLLPASETGCTQWAFCCFVADQVLASLRNVWTNPWRTTTPTHIYTVIQPTFLPPLVLRTSCMVAISFRLSP